jgi:cell surface protein SprA
MSAFRNVRPFRLTLLLLLSCLATWTASAYAIVGFRASLLSDSSSSNFLTRSYQHGISSFGKRPVLDIGVGARSLNVDFDSTYSEATLSMDVKTTHLMQPTILNYPTYAAQRMRADLYTAWRDGVDKSYKAAGKEGLGEGIAIDLPYRIKSKTFRRLFGGDNVGVRVQGNISINGSLRRQKFDELQAATQQNTNTAFRIDMVQQFTITGKIGQKVEVKVDQDSERMFDFENSLKLTYTGDEDEVIQKIEAGNVDLNLGTKLATFSGKNTGLFGLKTQAKIGPLSLTGIASLERGQKNRQSPNQQTSRSTWTEKDMMDGVYYWITNTDVAGGGRAVPNFRENYRHFVNRTHIAVPQPQQIRDIQVWESSNLSQNTAGNVQGQAAALQVFQHVNDNPFPANGGGYEQTTWRQLSRGVDYDVDLQLGFIRLRQKIGSTTPTALACAFSLVGDTLPFGTLSPPTAENPLRLVLLRPENPQPSDTFTWNLTFRNVYSLQASNIDPNNFKLTIVRSAAAQVGGREETGPPGQNETYLTFFDFDKQGPNGATGPDGLIDNGYPAICDLTRGELQFLDLTPFDPSGYFDSAVGPDTIKWPLKQLETTLNDSGGFTAPYLYNSSTVAANQSPKWSFRTEFKGSSSVFDLGPLVLENSEEVTLNGQKLTRGVDYTVDYSSGQLRILNEAAKASGANLDITYESGRVSQLEKTSLLGARAEYALWQDSYIGGMLLYLNQSTLDQRVRIGMEPIRNTLWDMNTSLKFKPDFLTRAVDWLPLVRTDSPSDMTINGEVARVYPNPNSLENSRTGDFNGLAYLDDFEGSRRATPLGLNRRTWTISSIPDRTTWGLEPRRGRLRWYNPNPRDQVPVKDVYPEREVNSQVANTLQSIIFEFKPDPSTDAGLEPEKSWGGVMRYLGEGYADETRAQYLEFWIDLPSNLSANPNAKLVVDLGTISEDALPNDTLDTEDLPLPGQVRTPRQSLGNNVLEPNEDTGLDGKFGTDPQDSAYWNGLDQPPVPSWDDWSFSAGSSDFSHINGTEHNRNDESGGFPDTEDLNNNQNLDQVNAYYSYRIDLNSTRYIAGENPNNRWRLFRIPIAETDPNVRKKVGAADLANVRWARVYVTGIRDTTRFTKIELVQMDIVSNEWLSAITPSDSTEYVSTAVINTHENPGYNSPPGVEGEVDPITNLRQREQSLVLKINDLYNYGPNIPPSPTGVPREFFVAKNLYQETNLTEYKRLKMFVHGGDTLEIRDPHFHAEEFQLILRFGLNYSDLNNNYYDIVETVQPGWSPENVIDVALNDLSQLVPARAAAVADTVHYPGLLPNGRFAVENTNTPWLEDSLVIMGNPTMSRVGFIGLGVRMNSPKFKRGSDTEIWVDELRVSDIYKDPGTAADVSSAVNIADFVQVSGGYQATDADFHNVNTRVNASNMSTDAKLANATINLHKIWLERFGFRLPVSLSYNATDQIPRIIPGTDTRITPSQAPDSIQSHSKTFSYRVQYSKAATGKNPLVKWTLEKLSASWDYSKDQRTDYATAYNNSEQSNAQLSYTFPTSKGRGLAPFWWGARMPLLAKLAEMRFYFKPTKLSASAQVTKRLQNQLTRAGIMTGSKQFQTQRTVSTGFAPFDPITLDYSRTHQGQMLTGDWANLLQWDWGLTNSITQNFTGNYNPEILPWLKPTFSYSGSYNWANANQQANGQTLGNQRNLGTDLQLDFRSIFGESGGRGRGRSRDRGRDREHDRESSNDPRHMPGDPRDLMKGDSLGSPHGGMLPPHMPMHGDSLEHGAGAEGSHGGEKPDSTQGRRGSDSTMAKGNGLSPLQMLGAALGPLRKALTTIDPIALSYDNTASHSQSGTIGQATTAYQFGLSQNPGVPVAESYGGIPSRRSDANITARSGMRVTQDVRLAFNYGHRASETITQYRQGSVDQSMLWFGTGKKTSAYPFVDVSADWSGLEKFKFLSGFTKTVSLSSAISNKVQENWANSRDSVQSRAYTRQWNPLLRVNISWKGDIDSQIGYNSTSSYTNTIAQGTRSRSTDNRLTASVSYTIHTGFKLPLLFMRSIHLQNQTTLSMNVDYGKQKQEVTQGGNDIYAPTAATSSWSIQPRMTYSFSNTVQGQGYVQFQQTQNDISKSKSRVFEFGIQVNIAIRG